MTFKVPYTKVISVIKHPQADALDIVTVYGWQVIVKRDLYKVGDMCIYIPVDSVLEPDLESLLFGLDAKIKLTNSRIRAIKIRGILSQGMLIHPSLIKGITNYKLEDDLADLLKVKKYEPPAPKFQTHQSQYKKRKPDHPNFSKYGGLSNIKWFPDFFKPNESVTIQEKLHGTNARAGILPYHASTLWKKLKKLLRLAPAYEQIYGSNNVEISSRSSYTGFYADDIYGKVFTEMKVFDKLKAGEVVYGEIVGPNIQKNYDYGLKHHKFLLFDVLIISGDEKRWLSPKEVKQFAAERGFEMVPTLYVGPFNKKEAEAMTKGASVLDPNTKVREGIVIKANFDYSLEGNRRSLKWISEDYLSDKNNSDFH